MQVKFPQSREAWSNDVERRLNRLRADFAMLWRLMPQTPEWPGIPMSGPLSPLPFEWFPPVNTGGTVPSGTLETGGTIIGGGTLNTGGTANKACEACPFASSQYSFSLSGLTNNICASCTTFNTTHVMSVTAINSCQWRTGLGACNFRATLTYNAAFSGVGITGTGPGTALTISITPTPPGTQQSIWTYRQGGCPPAVGGSMTLQFESLTISGGGTSPACNNMPTSITITGI